MIHGTRPLTVECARDRLGGAVTPLADVFVRQNLDLPDPRILADRDAWTLDVEGEGVLTLADLKRLPTTTRRVVMECAGNARTLDGGAYPGETPWGVGAVACVEWTGVALSDLVTPTTARFCTATGADSVGRQADPFDQRVERSVPAAKAMADGLLAWALNGEPIPLVHGGPLRFVVPGYFAVNSVKFVNRLAFGDEESDADIQRTRYRYRPPGTPPSTVHPTTGPLPPTSLIIRAEQGRVHGVAWSSDGPISRVDVTVDGGGSWRHADLERASDPAAWSLFSAAVPAARQRVAARAVDAAGAVQPAKAEPNALGYANNGWRSLAVDSGEDEPERGSRQ